MVEANPTNLQIPVPEESKDENVSMVGTTADMSADIRKRLEGIDLNPLESGLLEHYLRDKETFVPNIHSLLVKLAQRYNDDAFCIKRLQKVIPLFVHHEFWNTQPVPNYFDFTPQASYNKPIEQKQISDILTDPLPLPAGY